MSSWFSCQYEQTLGKEGGFIFLTVFWGVGGLDIQFVVSGRWGSGSVHSQLLASQQDENQTLSQVSSSPPFIHSGLWTLSWCHSHSGWVPPPPPLLELSGNAQMLMPGGVSPRWRSVQVGWPCRLAITPWKAGQLALTSKLAEHLTHCRHQGGYQKHEEEWATVSAFWELSRPSAMCTETANKQSMGSSNQ